MMMYYNNNNVIIIFSQSFIINLPLWCQQIKIKMANIIDVLIGGIFILLNILFMLSGSNGHSFTYQSIIRITSLLTHNNNNNKPISQ